jgi:hypothetical protein
VATGGSDLVGQVGAGDNTGETQTSRIEVATQFSYPTFFVMWKDPPCFTRDLMFINVFAVIDVPQIKGRCFLTFVLGENICNG